MGLCGNYVNIFKEKKPIFDDEIDITDIDPDYKDFLKDNIDTEVLSGEYQKGQGFEQNTSITKLSKREKENRKKKLDSMLDHHYYTVFNI